jgi:5-deoxy-glucuronate isomerase
VRLAPGETHSATTASRELGIVVLGGTTGIQAGGATFAALGRRADVFGGRASALYLPPHTDFSIVGASEGPAQVALCYAECEEGGPITRIDPEDVVSRAVGRSNWARRVEDVFAKAPASRLLLGETYNVPGGWSSYPPHKHDTDVPGREVVLEEIYHYRISPSQGFGVQCVYQGGEAEDQAFVVKDGDSVVIPGGYHPVVAAPGYSLCYLWVLAGPRRTMRPNDDPAHAWLKAVEAMLP